MSETEEAVAVAQADGRDFVTQADVEAAQTPERPEWLPEKYKTPEDLANAYKALESKLGTKEEDIRNAILEEIQGQAFADRPETANDYQLPESIDESAAVDDELLRWWSEHSFENGYSQEEFEQGIEMYAQAVMGSQPDLEAEAAKLGDNANARIEAASNFANKFFPENALPAIERMCETAEGILALEVIQEALKDGSFSGNATPTAGVSPNEIREMMRDPRYWQEKDPYYVNEVTKLWQQLERG